MTVDNCINVDTENLMNRWLKALLGFSKVHSTAAGAGLRLDAVYSRAEIENLRQQIERYDRTGLRGNALPKRLPSDWVRDVWRRGGDEHIISRSCRYLLDKYGMQS